MCKLGVISKERLKIEVKLLLSDNRKSYMSHRLAQQRVTLSDLEWPFHPHRALSLQSTLTELLVVLRRHALQNTRVPGTPPADFVYGLVCGGLFRSLSY